LSTTENQDPGEESSQQSNSSFGSQLEGSYRVSFPALRNISKIWHDLSHAPDNNGSRGDLHKIELKSDRLTKGTDFYSTVYLTVYQKAA
jgi:hypothetical protein